MGATLAIWLSIGGLGLDFSGAALLAYDILCGPNARVQASIRRTKLAIARESRERYQRRLDEVSRSSAPSHEQVQRVQQELSILSHQVDKNSTELKHWERHEHRAQLNALLGLLCLMAGFACQAVSAVLTGLPG